MEKEKDRQDERESKRMEGWWEGESKVNTQANKLFSLSISHKN